VIFPRVRAIPAGTLLPPNYEVDGITSTRDESAALSYLIPNKRGGKPSKKNIPEAEWELAYEHLISAEEFSRVWFETNIPCSKNGGCNFRVIGEVFVLLNIAQKIGALYASRKA